MTSRKTGPVARRWIAGIIVGALCVWLSVRTLDLAQVGVVLAQARVGLVLLAVTSVLGVAVTKALRWWILFPRRCRTRSWLRTFSVLMTAQMLNVLVPIRVGELARLGLMLQEGVPAGTTLSTIVLEKSLDLVAAGVLITLAVSGLTLPEWFPLSAGVTMGLSGGALLVALVGIWLAHAWIERLAGRVIGFRDWLPGPVQARLLRFVRAMLEGLGTLTGFGTALPIFGLTIASWIISVVTIIAMLMAFGLPAAWQVALVLSLTVYLSNLVPAPPALVGVVSAVAVMTLQWFGVAGEDAMALGLVLNAVLIGPLVLIGGWATWQRFSALTGGARRERWVWSLGLGRERE
jgi:uncharacterized protein (TIRG00374 family)